MPLRLADLAAKTKDARIEWEGETVTLDVRYQLITPRFLSSIEQLQAMQADTGQVGAALVELCARLALLIASWDVYDLDGITMYPLDAERMAAELPAPFLYAVLAGALGVMQPGEASAPGATSSASAPRSGATSSPMAG